MGQDARTSATSANRRTATAEIVLHAELLGAGANTPGDVLGHRISDHQRRPLHQLRERQVDQPQGHPVIIPTLRTRQLPVQPQRTTFWHPHAALDADIDVFTIMPFDFFGGADMYGNTVNAANGLRNQLKNAFGWSDATAYAHMGISGMNGLSDQSEVTTPAIWTRIRDWANANHIARLALWSVNRDRPCASGGLAENCSGISQTNWRFTTITAGFTG